MIATSPNTSALAKIIFQTLDDFESACVEAASPGTEVRGNLNFEIGVFSGAYVTPIPAG